MGFGVVGEIVGRGLWVNFCVNKVTAIRYTREDQSEDDEWRFVGGAGAAG